MVKKNIVVAILATFCLTSTLFMIVPIQSQSGVGEYDPWTDLNGDGTIDIFDIVQVAIAFGSSGPPIAKASIEYDSGWINITDKCGQYFNIIHNLNSTDLIVELAGRVTPDGEIHQRNVGLTSHMPGLSKTFGVNDSMTGVIAETNDGGYLIAGSMYNVADFLLVKTDSYGNMQWSRTYRGSSPELAADGSPTCAIQTSDGGYAIVGVVWRLGLGSQWWLVKTDFYGNAEWNRTYGGGINDDIAMSIVQTVDGGYAIAGYGFANLIKVDGLGNQLWAKSYGGEAKDLVLTRDGGFAICGATSSLLDSDFWFVKADVSGNIQWGKTYGGSDYDSAYSIVQTSDGGYALAGITGSFGAGYDDGWLIRTDGSGNAIWNKTYGGPDADFIGDIIQTSEGGFALAGGTTSPFGPPFDYRLIKTDMNGNTQWNRTYKGGEMPYGSEVVQTIDGGYAMACTACYFNKKYELWLVKADSELGLALTGQTNDSVTIYRGSTDPYWNFVRVRIWKPKTP